MLLASKAALSGIVLILVATGISRPGATLAPGANLSTEAPVVENPNDVKKLQQTLRDSGHYRGEVDGVAGLRTRAGIRAYQTAESLPVTGQLDTQTAGKLGIGVEGRPDNGAGIPQGKPSAAIKSAKGSRRTSKTPRKVAVKVSTLAPQK